MNQNKNVKIYIFENCPYCIRAAKLLRKENISFTQIQVSNDELDELEKQTECGTVPQIFVDDAFIGGCDDLLALYNNSKLFKEVFYD